MKKQAFRRDCCVVFAMVMFMVLVRGNPVEEVVAGVPDQTKGEPRSGDIDLSKPGTCPPERLVSGSRLNQSDCALDCFFDLECPGTQRCCPDHCGGAACIETSENTEAVPDTEPPTVVLPTFSEEPQDAYIIGNRPVTLSCRAQPVVQLYFHCDGEWMDAVRMEHHETTEDIEEQRMIVSISITRDDVDQYFGIEDFNCQCVGWSDVDTHTTSRQGYVRIASLKRLFDREPLSQRVGSRQFLQLLCRPPAGVPEPEVYWEKNGARINISDAHIFQTSEGLILHPIRLEDSGNYTCVAENLAARRLSAPAQVIVYDEPTTTPQATEPVPTTAEDSGINTDLHLHGDAVVNVSAEVGDDLVLRCSISSSGDEPLLLFWMVQIGEGFLPWSYVPPTDNKQVSDSGSELEISGVELDDAQRFVCFGGHSTGYLTQTYVVTVTEKTGENSTVPSDPCRRYPSVCQNGATCVQTAEGDGFSCACAEGWEGALCQNKTGACGSNPCHNGGSCAEQLEGAFGCTCPSEFTGARCDVEVVVTTTKPNESREEMSDVCYLPMDRGSCSRKEIKWYYNKEAQLCQEFIYNGCGGNANQFRSYDECQWECPELPRDPCTHPIVKGRCKAMIPRWAYSTESKTCVEFVYGGCAPTGNNFLSEEDCAQACMSDAYQQCERCGTSSLPRAYCDSDFVVTGIVRRQLFSDGQLKTIILELTRRYKGHSLRLQRSRFLDKPLVVAKSRAPESNRCLGPCFQDLEDGKEYIFTGTLSAEGAGETVAFLTSSSYVKPAVDRRLMKLELILNDRVFNRKCSQRRESPP